LVAWTPYWFVSCKATTDGKWDLEPSCSILWALFL
jgi:hypothetical protein